MHIARKFLILVSALAASGLAMAQDVGRVISSTPIIGQVSTPRRVCTSEQVEVQSSNSGAGAAIGAIAGAALGSASGGRRSDRAAASVIGAIGGAILGDHIEGTPEPRIRDVQRCGTQTQVENRPIAYNVVYEFAGKQYTVQMPQDPGPTIQLQVAPVGMASTQSYNQSYNTAPSNAPIVYDSPPVVMVAPAAYPLYPQPYYYGRPYYPAVRVDLEFGSRGGYGRRWH
jgi:uncharacterized protein YcfJ